MRSSKSRSRSKSNRNNSNRSTVNIVNRVFDSSGPESKVRGTPQQIIDKYNQLARDAQLSNDRVAAENFQQHAEHYLRMLGEAQRELDARREQDAAQQQQRDRQSAQSDQRGQNDPRGSQTGQTDRQGQDGGASQGGDQPRAEQPRGDEPRTRGEPRSDKTPEQTGGSEPPTDEPRRRTRVAKTPRQPARKAQDDVIDTPSDSDSGLVETPESKPAKPRRSRAKPKPNPEESAGDGSESGNRDGAPEAAE